MSTHYRFSTSTTHITLSSTYSVPCTSVPGFPHLFNPSLFLISNHESMTNTALNLRAGSIMAALNAWLSWRRSELILIHIRAVGGSNIGGEAEPEPELSLPLHVKLLKSSPSDSGDGKNKQTNFQDSRTTYKSPPHYKAFTFYWLWYPSLRGTPWC